MGSANDVLENWLAAKINQGLGKPRRYRPDARPVTGCENETLIHVFHKPSYCAITIRLKSEYKLSPEGAVRSVEAVAEARAVHIVLHVARIEMVEDVENSHTHFEFPFFAAKRNSQFLKSLNIQRIKSS